MRTRNVIAIGVQGLVLALLVVGYAVKAGNSYQLNSSVIAGGGGSLAAGSYSLTGTSGQSEAGQALANGNYSLQGGLWHTVLIQNGQKFIYLPLITR